MMRISNTIGLAVLITATNIHGQSATTTRSVKVEIKGPSPCTDKIHRNDINLVIGNDEANPLSVRRNQRGLPWYGYKEDGAPIAASGTWASARLTGLRTRCVKSAAIPDPKDPVASVAYFKFNCDEHDARSLKFATKKETPMGFTRRLEGDDNCTASAFYDDSGPRTVEDLWDTEELRLHLAWRSKDPSAPGLLVLSPNPRAPSVLSFKGRARKDRYELGRGGVVAQLEHQRMHGDGSAPTLSSTAIDLDTKELKASGINTLQISTAK